MTKEAKQLKRILERSKSILILTHKGPDFDAFCSGLILKKYIEIYHPKQKVSFKTRQIPTQNIPYMHEVEVVERIEEGDEDLLILTDAANLDMCLTSEDTVNYNQSKLVIIDHHDTDTADADLRINNNMSSATEQVLSLCMQTRGKRFEITEEISILGQIGIITDTGRFLYENAKPETYEMMAQLRRVAEFDVEEFSYKNSKFPLDTLVPMMEYIKNLESKDDMAYTYISKDIIESMELSKTSVNNAHKFIRDRIIRYIQGIHWGFVVKPSFYKENVWQISFRSSKGYQKVDKIAESLGGGGHEYSSAAKVEAKDGKEVVDIVLKVIKNFISS